MKWVIGDIHGCSITLSRLVEEIANIDSAYELGFLGDYVDRGKNSKQVIDYIIELQKQNRVFATLCGNHDIIWAYLCDVQMSGQHECDNYNRVVSWWVYNGLESCLNSYGIQYDSKHPYGLHNEIVEKVPDSHKKFLSELSLSWSNDEYELYHGMKPNVDSIDSESIANDILWGRPDILYLTANHTKTLIHGHTPKTEVGIYDKVIMLDTGSYRNKISAYCLDNKAIISVPILNGDVL